MKTINIKTSRPYNVIIERGSLKKSGELISQVIRAKKTVIVTDDTVNSLYADTLVESLEKSGISASVFVFPHGEQSKNLAVLSEIYDFLCRKNITRSDFLIALGGGVVGDITGFASATYLRGMEFVQIPTTLLAQVDSSVGGKTAIDITGGKNLVGSFKQPALVICDSNILRTLPESELSCGMAEVIKYGMIRDEKLFEVLENHDISSINEIMDDIVYTCVDIKREVVEHDECDNGERMMLNFGHTLGHAIEGWHNYTNYTHGMGVAVGMCMITERLCSSEITERLKKCVESYGLPTSTEAPVSELLPYCKTDKKCEADSINYIICHKIGKAEIKKVTVAEFERLMEG